MSLNSTKKFMYYGCELDNIYFINSRNTKKKKTIKISFTLVKLTTFNE